MTAEIVSVGTELLLGDIVDTNAAELGRALARRGIGHTHRQTVGDNLPRLAEALRLALSRSDLVFTIGGLGPTEDDMTRDGIAEALGVGMEQDAGVLEHLKALLERRGIRWAENQGRQALKPEGAEVVPNPNGTAPGLVCRKGGKVVAAMPGPRNEFVPMLEGPIDALLAELGDGMTIHSRTVKFAGIGESLIEERCRDLMQGGNPTLAPYAKTGEVHLRITARAKSKEEAARLIEPVEQELRSRLGRFVYGVDDATLASSVVQMLRENGQTLAVAESCTGGALGKFLTDAAGSSDAFVGGAIVYSNALKTSLAGVDPGLLEAKGAVSQEVAESLAEGIRKACGADWGIGITGVAGPGGGTPDKPVGLVYVAAAGPSGVRCLKNDFLGRRDAVRERAVMASLVLLRSELLKS